MNKMGIDSVLKILGSNNGLDLAKKGLSTVQSLIEKYESNQVSDVEDANNCWNSRTQDPEFYKAVRSKIKQLNETKFSVISKWGIRDGEACALVCLYTPVVVEDKGKWDEDSADDLVFDAKEEFNRILDKYPPKSFTTYKTKGDDLDPIVEGEIEDLLEDLEYNYFPSFSADMTLLLLFQK